MIPLAVANHAATAHINIHERPRSCQIMQNEPLSSTALAVEDQPTINHHSSISVATEDQPLVSPTCRAEVTRSRESDEGGSEIPTCTCREIVALPAVNLQLSTINHQLPPTVIDATALPATAQSHKARRKGRIACLPKPQRDMVNRMLSNGV